MKKKILKYHYRDIGCAKLDISRWERSGIPEAVYCPGKTLPQLKKIVASMHNRSGPILLTRAERSVWQWVKKQYAHARYFSDARMIVVRSQCIKNSASHIVVVTGGTADIPVAEQACVTAESLGCAVKRLFDVGVAGVHRLLINKKIFDDVSCVIVCAGMEGALASVVGGLVGVPVVAVPTSVGYGASFKGIAPLLTMLNSCAPNVSVVNIDNGFGAGVIAHLIAKNKCGKK